jgi:F0F1-type ATP synthase assembly protein I
MKKMEHPQSLKEKNQKSKVNNGIKNFAKYSNLALQMGAIIFVTTWGGAKLDKHIGFKTPICTIVLSLLGVFASIYIAIKDLIKFK